MYVIGYGIKGFHGDVNSDVYDAHKSFEIEKTKLKMLVPLDMNYNKIINLALPSHGDDVVNVTY